MTTPKSWQIKDKFTQDVLKEVPLLNQKEIESLIKNSTQGFNELRTYSAERRSRLLDKLKIALEGHKEEMATLISKEAGKPISYAKAEVERSLFTLGYAAEEVKRFGGEVVPLDFGAGTGRNAFTKRVPIGPCLGIAPFNFPLNLALHKLAPAIAVGNSIVLKPSPYTPLSLLFLRELAINEAGWAPHFFQVALCDNEGSEFLLKSDTFKFFSFTGSPQVGWMLKEKAGKKKVALELGGNAAVVIDKGLSDDRLKEIAETVATGSFLYAGQICISTQRVFCHQEHIKKFTDYLISSTKNLKVGDPKEDQTSVGPIIDETHCKRIESWVNEAKKEGATILLGGEVIKSGHNLYAPTILSNTHSEMKVQKEEVFGPVVCLEEVASFEAGIKAVNNSRFGLQVGVFTDSLSNFKKAIDECEVGGIIFNNIPGFRVDSMPYGGVKDSGLGREGLRYAMEDMTESRLVVY